jgi:methylthioribose-1-phosphate isomerase
MASDAVNAAATVMGTVGALQRQSAEAAQTLLGLAPPVPAAEIVAAPGVAATPKPISGAFRSPFRWEGDRLILLDQRRFPQDVVEVTCRTGPEVAQALRDRVVEGAPAIGQVAAYGLALTALAAVDSRPYQRLAMIRGMANALANARSAVAPATWSTNRLLARFESLDRLTDDGPGVGAALVEEAEAVATWYMDAHLRLVEVGLAALPDRSTAVRALVHGQVGALASGQVGSALGLLQAARRPGVSVTAYVTEGRPNLAGTRLTAWELAQSDIAHWIVSEASVGHLMARGDIDLVLVGADRIAADGALANSIGTYGIAVLAARHGIPVVVCSATPAIDLSVHDATRLTLEDRSALDLLTVEDRRIAPRATMARNPADDITPPDLINLLVTEEGVVENPDARGLAAMVDAAEARWPPPRQRAADPAVDDGNGSTSRSAGDPAVADVTGSGPG